MKFLTNDPIIIEELVKIQKQIVKINRSSDPFFNQSLDYLAATGGKMLRPTFVLISGTFGETTAVNKERIRTLATSIETLHLATLIHDDIVDESHMRRGQETIWTKYSKEYAVYMGDYLFTQTFMMLADQEISSKSLKEISKGVAYICKGEMRQNAFRYKNDLSVRNYLDVIRGKTASLFALSLSIGAYETGTPEDIIHKLFKIGLNVGMAFQIIDDLLDYTGSSELVGKDVQKDILKGYYSLPLILALKTSASSELKTLLNRDHISEENISKLIHVVSHTTGVEQAQKFAQRYTDKALQGILSLPSTTGKKILEELIPKLLIRNH